MESQQRNAAFLPSVYPWKLRRKMIPYQSELAKAQQTNRPPTQSGTRCMADVCNNVCWLSHKGARKNTTGYEKLNQRWMKEKWNVH